MKITIESTDLLFMVDGQPCRLWNGTTERGTPCELFVRLVQASPSAWAEFNAELHQAPNPSPGPRPTYLGPLHNRPSRN